MSQFIRPSAPAAKWLKPSELDDPYYQFEPGKILLGQTKDGRFIGIDDNRHLMTIAGSRAGKTATSLLPNLLTWRGSVLAIDPKGELATNTAHIRAEMGQEVAILDPFGEVTDEKAAPYRRRFDPLSEIMAGDEDDIIDNAALIAEALIMKDGNAQSDHWSMSAKNVIRGLILWAIVQDRKGYAPLSLNTVRKWATSPLEDVEDSDQESLLEMFKLMMDDHDAFDGVVAGVGGTMTGKPDDERGSILSTAVEQSAFLDSKKMKEHFKAPNFETLRVLKRQPTTVYLVLPASRMATHFRWLRLILTLAMAALENEPNRLPLRYPDVPENDAREQVLFVLEEFPQLGHMRQLEAAAGLMAGYDVKLWTVIQDLTQIKALYKDSWETFIGNAGIVEAFGNNDTTTLEYLSKKIGMTLAQQIQPDNPSLAAQQGGATRERETITTVPLLAAHEISQKFAREENRKLIMLANKPPFAVKRVFWKDLCDG